MKMSGYERKEKIENEEFEVIPIDFYEDICRNGVIGESLMCSENASPVYIRYGSFFRDDFVRAETERLHIHNYYELSVAINGEFAVNINNTIYKLNNGDIVIFRPGEPHFHTSTKIGDIEFLEIDIEKDFLHGVQGGDVILKCFEKRKFCEKNIILAENNMSNIVQKAMRKLISHLNTGKDNKMLIYSYFIQFMYAVNDAFGQQSSDVSDRSIPDVLYSATEYIRKNLTSVQNLAEISKYLGVSVSYLCRIFKSYLKMTPREYIVSHRIEYAKVLLVNSDRSVLQVCYDSGFNDYSSFITLFKRKVGTTPLAYRRSF